MAVVLEDTIDGAVNKSELVSLVFLASDTTATPVCMSLLHLFCLYPSGNGWVPKLGTELSGGQQFCFPARKLQVCFFHTFKQNTDILQGLDLSEHFSCAVTQTARLLSQKGYVSSTKTVFPQSI